MLDLPPGIRCTTPSSEETSMAEVQSHRRTESDVSTPVVNIAQHINADSRPSQTRVCSVSCTTPNSSNPTRSDIGYQCSTPNNQSLKAGESLTVLNPSFPSDDNREKQPICPAAPKMAHLRLPLVTDMPDQDDVFNHHNALIFGADCGMPDLDSKNDDTSALDFRLAERCHGKTRSTRGSEARELHGKYTHISLVASLPTSMVI